MNIRLLFRHEIDEAAWNACVTKSPNRIIYGYSWYLDAVTSAAGWTWAGIVETGNSVGYQLVMPVPLRRKWGRWVVHQPLFCQFLAIYSGDLSPDPDSLFRVMQQRFRYGSVLHYQQIPTKQAIGFQTRLLHTSCLDLSPAYPTIAGNYTRDRVLNLRRAMAAGWQIIDSTDPEPLIQLFQTNHAAGISGGVAPWAYIIFRNLFGTTEKRGLMTLRYALKNDSVEAGVLFIREGNRIVYLFNAASETGRQGNARTLMIDQVIRENAGTPNLVLDFESPEKTTIAQFYQSFGGTPTPFWEVKYNRLTWLEQQLQPWLTQVKHVGDK